jgi:predicted MFS family arabinose efflux permease
MPALPAGCWPRLSAYRFQRDRVSLSYPAASTESICTDPASLSSLCRAAVRCPQCRGRGPRDREDARDPSNTRHLALATVSFAVCFAAWGLISAFASRFREVFALSATETALLVAVPVLLGSLARLPVGILADRFGGRLVFTVLMLLVALPAWLVPTAGSYRMLLWIAFFLGIAGSSFPVGVGYVSRWTPAERQGGQRWVSTA